ncbi:XRE family transcriptional regulator [Streptomyces sp. ISL-11]|uniref:XRE family transcriptional regulator n=1 Tax=Streptomyces sp. ISL-11 TaxID=2819174 RepID=UPI001BEC000A|nr:XRE family transcriptional regulator [Streptomyces sp. ISL-11]MBT2384260.1 XRE family transcriptional regulator [Streptomyces sp. ISL-11]
MRGTTGVPPQGARDAGEFTARMRRLKERSGLTYRELEQRAQDRGDVLARSTLSDVLQRQALPRPELLVAFLRACGVDDEREVAAWLETRSRIEAAPGGPRPRFLRSAFVAPAALALLIALLATGAWLLLPDDDARPSARPSAPHGWVEIRPARTTHLCLTEGRDRSGAYPNAVAAQRPCTEARPPHTYLKPVRGGPGSPYYIEWHHPKHGKGCLTIRRAAPAKNMLEPWDACTDANTDQHFRVEPAGTTGTATRYRLRPEGSSLCIGIGADDTRPEAEAVEEPCTGAADQQFLIENVA